MNEHIDFFLPLRIFFKTKYFKKNHTKIKIKIPRKPLKAAGISLKAAGPCSF